jgi:hypothetical protein
MPISNLNNDHFTPGEMDDVSNSWDKIIGVLTGKSRNLSPEERQKFGSIAEKNKLVVLKSMDYHTNQAHLDCPDVDYKELAADWADRTFLAGFISKMAEANNICNNIRITHDFDAYQAARKDYDYTKYKLSTDPGAGWESKYNDLLPFFKTNDGPGGGDQPDTPDA